MFEVLVLACLGIFGGAFTGLVPGVHPNTLTAVIMSGSGALLGLFPPHAVGVFIITAAITHTFLSYIPCVFIGAPDAGTALSVLPGHRLLQKGRGYEAVYLTVLGGVGVVVLSVVLLPVLMVVLPYIYVNVKVYMAWLLLGIVGVMVWTESGVKKVFGVLCFLLSGMLGVVVLGTPVLPSHLLLFPVFTGLFGVSTLLVGIRFGLDVPRQRTWAEGIGFKGSVKGIFKGLVSGIGVGIMPGLGAAQAGMLTHMISGVGRGGPLNTREFLVSLGGINTIAALFSLLALHLISRPRSGVAVAVQSILSSFGLEELLLCVAATLFATGIAAVLTLKTAGWFAGLLGRVSYRKLSWMIILLLVVLTVLMTGSVGLFILLVSTATGLLAPLSGVKRTHCMGVLMLPVVLWYLGI